MFLDRDSAVSAAVDGTLVHWDAQRLSIRSVYRGMGEAVGLDFNANPQLSIIAAGNTLWRSALEKQTLSKPEPFRLRPPAWKQPVTALSALPLHGLTLFGCDDGALHLAM